jgi:hypothetical protein
MFGCLALVLGDGPCGLCLYGDFGILCGFDNFLLVIFEIRGHLFELFFHFLLLLFVLLSAVCVILL